MFEFIATLMISAAIIQAEPDIECDVLLAETLHQISRAEFNKAVDGVDDFDDVDLTEYRKWKSGVEALMEIHETEDWWAAEAKWLEGEKTLEEMHAQYDSCYVYYGRYNPLFTELGLQ